MVIKKLNRLIILLSIISTSCERVPGPEGKQSLIDITTETPGSNCSSGGFKVSSGIDQNSNGILEDAEIQNTEYICHGDDGKDGSKSLISVVPITEGEICPSGGYQILSGIDFNFNNTLDSIEIQNTGYICNGINGINGFSFGDPQTDLKTNTIYKASSDGLLYIYFYGSTNGISFSLFADSNPEPQTEIAQITWHGSITIPLSRNTYWKLIVNYNIPESSVLELEIKWIPIID